MKRCSISFQVSLFVMVVVVACQPLVVNCAIMVIYELKYSDFLQFLNALAILLLPQFKI